MTGAVIYNPPFGRDLGRALLLVLFFLCEVAVSKNLQVNQAYANSKAPNQKDGRKDVQAGVGAGTSAGIGHFLTQTTMAAP
jgi:hypothetical protein